MTSLQTIVIKTLLNNISLLWNESTSYNKGGLNTSFTNDEIASKITLIETIVSDVEYNIKDRPLESKQSILLQISEIKKNIKGITNELKNIQKEIARHYKEDWFPSLRAFKITNNQLILEDYKRKLKSSFDNLKEILQIDIYKK